MPSSARGGAGPPPPQKGGAHLRISSAARASCGRGSVLSPSPSPDADARLVWVSSPSCAAQIRMPQLLAYTDIGAALCMPVCGAGEIRNSTSLPLGVASLDHEKTRTRGPAFHGPACPLEHRCLRPHHARAASMRPSIAMADPHAVYHAMGCGRPAIRVSGSASEGCTIGRIALGARTRDASSHSLQSAPQREIEARVMCRTAIKRRRRVIVPSNGTLPNRGSVPARPHRGSPRRRDRSLPP